MSVKTRVRTHGTEAYTNASPRKVDHLIEVAIRYVWRSRKPRRWLDERRRRRPGGMPGLHWRAATVLLILMYDLGITYRGMEKYLESRPGLLKRLRLKEAPWPQTLNVAYWRLDHTWFMDLNKRIVARVEWEERRQRTRP